jgi:hypothetical protein
MISESEIPESATFPVPAIWSFPTRAARNATIPPAPAAVHCLPGNPPRPDPTRPRHQRSRRDGVRSPADLPPPPAPRLVTAPPDRFLRSGRAFLTLLSLSPFLRESVGAVFGLSVGVLATWIAAYELAPGGQSCWL